VDKPNSAKDLSVSFKDNIMSVSVAEQSLKKYRFSLPVKVRFADIDLQGHVFFGNYFIYCDEGFMAFLEEVGYSWPRLESVGLELYYIESSCQFKERAIFGDMLLINIGIVEMGRSSISTQMIVLKNKTDEVKAIGQIKAVMVSKETGRSTPIPDGLREAIHQYEKR